MTDYTVYVMEKNEKLLYGLISFTAFFTAGYLFYDSIVFSVMTGAAGAAAARPEYLRHRNDERKKDLRSQFGDLLHSISASVATGRSMSEALRDGRFAVEQVHGEKALLAKELARMDQTIRESNQREEVLLTDLGKRSGVEDIRNFAAVYAACRETGCDLEKVIRKATAVLGDKMRIEKEMQVMSAQKRLEGRIITLLPFGVILFLRVASPEYIAPLYQMPEGKILMTCALAGMFWACRMIEALSRISA